MGRAAKDNGSARWFVVSDDAARATVEAAIRGALAAQRSRLASVYVDMVSDHDWPAGARATVRLAERRSAANRHGGVSLTLDPRVDEDFDIVLALAPFSIGCTGTSSQGELIWDANDTGTSAAFALTPAEERAVRSAISRAGGAADDLMRLSEHHLGRRALNYSVVGGTAPAAEPWLPPDGWRAYEHTVRLGSGTDVWNAASSAVLSWGIKSRSGFTVDPLLEAGRIARRGERYWLVARIGPLHVREPVEVVATIATDRQAALAYGTLEGHPVSGEETFIVRRDENGNVNLTLRSLTRAGRGPWRGLFPLILIAQRVYRRRYLRALRRGGQ
ncbi:hypothetical protein GCM10017772_05920 [Promicromonospora soli]|uniref:DUF1990 domain-containing protein n=1 Tax=Promicromonospora soli TaxID=2035533 RepID=A0A919FIG6_9MICO|nr:hypothetical protein GCM10017772_05920 [Promicromonospora soli]